MEIDNAFADSPSRHRVESGTNSTALSPARRVCAMFSDVASATLPYPFITRRNRGDRSWSSAVTPAFRDGARALLQDIVGVAAPKTVGGSAMTGPRLVSLMQVRCTC